MTDPAQVVMDALESVKVVRRDHLHFSIRASSTVLTANVEPFTADPRSKIDALYERFKAAGVTVSGIEWGATSPDFADCQQFRFVISGVEADS